jgi:hypothetical protein
MPVRKGSYELSRRIMQVERAFGVNQKEEWLDILMWGASKAGVFGHVHMRIPKHGGETKWTACSEEEELQLMRMEYEESEHRLYGRGEPLSFSAYLENFSFLGPAELSERRREIIERINGEEESEKSLEQ